MTKEKLNMYLCEYREIALFFHDIILLQNGMKLPKEEAENNISKEPFSGIVLLNDIEPYVV